MLCSGADIRSAVPPEGNSRKARAIGNQLCPNWSDQYSEMWRDPQSRTRDWKTETGK